MKKKRKPTDDMELSHGIAVRWVMIVVMFLLNVCSHGFASTRPSLKPDEDPDRDGLTNEQEWQKGTSPTNPDSDGDGVKDGEDQYPLDPRRSNDVPVQSYATIDASGGEESPAILVSLDDESTMFTAYRKKIDEREFVVVKKFQRGKVLEVQRFPLFIKGKYDSIDLTYFPKFLRENGDVFGDVVATQCITGSYLFTHGFYAKRGVVTEVKAPDPFASEDIEPLCRSMTISGIARFGHGFFGWVEYEDRVTRKTNASDRTEPLKVAKTAYIYANRKYTVFDPAFANLKRQTGLDIQRVPLCFYPAALNGSGWAVGEYWTGKTVQTALWSKNRLMIVGPGKPLAINSWGQCIFIDQRRDASGKWECHSLFFDGRGIRDLQAILPKPFRDQLTNCYAFLLSNPDTRGTIHVVLTADSLEGKTSPKSKKQTFTMQLPGTKKVIFTAGRNLINYAKP